MEERLNPIRLKKFEKSIRRHSDSQIDYTRYFQPYIDKIEDFAIGPSFWLIPEQINMEFFDASENIDQLTPFRRDQWKQQTVHFWLENIHPDDRDFFLAATFLSIEFLGLYEHININLYLRMLNVNNQFRWVLIQYPTRCHNDKSEVIAGLVIITDISHLQLGSHCIMTVMDKMNKSNKFYTLKYEKTELKEHNLPQLGKRQQEVLELIAKGLTTPQIAAALFISYNTVENHKRNLRQKLGAKTSGELIAYAFKYQLL
ncbi:MAG TPA: LuxR C-terminal-related transcriptional regulator [Saprospiraceae bacterium]|nr:LuxR C-terminal-related transcriptional regulator [Saprospiraceae bacterium]